MAKEKHGRRVGAAGSTGAADQGDPAGRVGAVGQGDAVGWADAAGRTDAVDQVPAEVDCGAQAAGDAGRESTAPRDAAPTARLTSPYVTFEDPAAADGGSTARPAAASRRRGRIAASVAAAAGLALIVCSLGFMAPDPDAGWSLAWLFQTTASEADASRAGSTAGSSTSSSGSGASSDADTSQQEGDQQAAEASEASASEDAAGAASSGGSASSGSGAQAPADASGAAGSAAASSDGSGQASGGAATGGSSSAQPEQPQRQTVTVSVAVSSDAVGGTVAASGTYTFDQGATVYDALQALGLSVNAQSSQYGIYVSAIGGLAEKEHGAMSGWMYTVNGRVANVACSAYKLHDGDAVSWYYVTGN